VLLDTHAFLWFALGDEQMSVAARAAVAGATVAYVSAASVWEIRTKHRLGRLPEANALVTDLPGHVRRIGLAPLSIDLRDADLAGALEGAHRDPLFDRMLAA
jgi:PIN domain nuclease of toxin-antitoxin system